MCNLYSQTKGPQYVIDFNKTMAVSNRVGNLPPQRAIFPDGVAPVLRKTNEGAELINMRWGFPPPPNVGSQLVTNVRNVKSGFWRPWLKPEQRCVVPWTSFCEYRDTKPRKTPVWFALDDDRPLAFFAGIWRPWTGVRGTKAAPADGEHLLYSFLTCEPNEIVKPVHPKAMPVILTTSAEVEQWLTAPAAEALDLQRPLPNEGLKIVAEGERADG